MNCREGFSDSFAWLNKGAMHPETRITANSPVMMRVVVYFLGMVTLPVDILQYFLLRYLHFIICFFWESDRGRPAVAKHFGVLLS